MGILGIKIRALSGALQARGFFYFLLLRLSQEKSWQEEGKLKKIKKEFHYQYYANVTRKGHLEDIAHNSGQDQLMYRYRCLYRCIRTGYFDAFQLEIPTGFLFLH